MYIKTWPALHPKISQAKQLKPYKLWLLLRHADKDGAGRVPLSSLDFDAFSREHARQTLREYDGIWWGVYIKGGELWIAYRSLEKIAHHFQLPKFSMKYAELPYHAFTGNFSTFCGFCLLAWIRARHDPDNPISKATLAELFGTWPKTIYRWVRACNAKVKYNFAEVYLDNVDQLEETDDDTLKTVVGEYTNAQMEDRASWVKKDGDKLRFQRPNCYHHPDIELGSRGAGKHVHESCRKLFCKPTDESYERVYYDKKPKHYPAYVLQGGIPENFYDVEGVYAYLH